MQDSKIFKKDLFERLLNFAVGVIQLIEGMKKTFTVLHIGKQLIRASTSSGAKYEEACGAESKADFLHKLQLVLKELRESAYWLRLLLKAKLGDTVKVQTLLNECIELSNIIGKSISTLKHSK